MRTTISLYLRNINCYVALRGVLALLIPLAIQYFFGKLQSPGSIGECMETVQTVFSTLEGMLLFCKILNDEVTVQPAIRDRGNHLVGYAVDQHDEAARTVLVLMVAPLMASAFVARLILLYSLSAGLLFDQIIHDCSGFVFLVMTE